MFNKNNIKTISLITVLAMSNIANAESKGDGSKWDSATLTFTADNPLVCGVSIGEGNLSTGSNNLSWSNTDRLDTQISKVKLINNSGGKVRVTPSIELDASLTGKAADQNNYEFKLFNGGYPSTLPWDQATLMDNNTEGYAALLQVKSGALTKADLPYGNVDYTVTLDISCE